MRRKGPPRRQRRHASARRGQAASAGRCALTQAVGPQYEAATLLFLQWNRRTRRAQWVAARARPWPPPHSLRLLGNAVRLLCRRSTTARRVQLPRSGGSPVMRLLTAERCSRAVRQLMAWGRQNSRLWSTWVREEGAGGCAQQRAFARWLRAGRCCCACACTLVGGTEEETKDGRLRGRKAARGTCTS